MPSKAKITTKRIKDIRNIYEGYTKDNYTINLSLTYFFTKKTSVSIFGYTRFSMFNMCLFYMLFLWYNEVQYYTDQSR